MNIAKKGFIIIKSKDTIYIEKQIGRPKKKNNACIYVMLDDHIAMSSNILNYKYTKN